MNIRAICHDDYHKGYMALINYFTRSPLDCSYEDFVCGLERIWAQNSHIFVIEDNSKIVGTIKVLIEHKLHNNQKPVGHIEDVVVCEEYRQKGIGNMLIQHGISVCKQMKCYKIVLACNSANVDFYKKCGFIEKGVEMSLYL